MNGVDNQELRWLLAELDERKIDIEKLKQELVNRNALIKLLEEHRQPIAFCRQCGNVFAS